MRAPFHFAHLDFISVNDRFSGKEFCVVPTQVINRISTQCNYYAGSDCGVLISITCVTASRCVKPSLWHGPIMTFSTLAVECVRTDQRADITADFISD